MTDEEMIKEGYNKFSDYPLFAYHCMSYLIDNTNSELLWKLLYYNDNNAWKNDSSHPNLTKIQKGELIYDGSPDETKYRAFLDFGMDNPWDIEACQIRISPVTLNPQNYVIGNILMGFEVYCHFKINTLSNYQTRIDTITQLLISAFNGQNIDGIGKLYFDARANRACNTTIIGQIPFKGKRTIMCNWIT
jgi:hypothetical protein